MVKQTSKTSRVLLSNWQNSATHFNGGEKLHSLLDVLTVVWVALCLVPTMLCHHLTLPVSVLGTHIYIYIYMYLFVTYNSDYRYSLHTFAFF